MMWKPSSKQRKINNRAAGASMENHKIKHQPHLSGAYIRTLVKHLTCKHKTHPESLNSNMQQESPPPPPPPPPHRKQVRRRRHTTKPYQQRLLNMAEARREIVTALKFHRASMKQRETAANHPDQSPSTTAAAAAYWPPAIPPSLPPIDLDFPLPNRTLGLNLNFQHFKNLDTNLYHNPPSNYPTSSSSSSSSAVISVTIEEVAAGIPEEVVTASTTTYSCSSSSSNEALRGLHHAVDDEGMEEIRSLGEQHQMEWNDTVNLLTSARWSEFLKTIEMEQGGKFDQDMVFPYCIDIGEIEGVDGEWLA